MGEHEWLRATRAWMDRTFEAERERDVLVKTLEYIRDGYANQNISHVDFRVKAYQAAIDALENVHVGQTMPTSSALSEDRK